MLFRSKLRTLPGRLHDPLRRRKPTVFFVNSMSDLFHDDVPFAYIDRVMQTIGEAHWHTFQVLTKRAERLAEYFAGKQIPPNAWIGVSVEDRRHGVPRIELLRSVAARIRFLSIEPLLEDLGELDLSGIQWVIVGGESGADARPMQAAWVRRIRTMCEAQGVRFFFKQWGSWGPDGKRRSKANNGRELDGQIFDAMPTLFAAA